MIRMLAEVMSIAMGGYAPPGAQTHRRPTAEAAKGV